MSFILASNLYAKADSRLVKKYQDKIGSAATFSTDRADVDFDALAEALKENETLNELVIVNEVNDTNAKSLARCLRITIKTSKRLKF